MSASDLGSVLGAPAGASSAGPSPTASASSRRWLAIAVPLLVIAGLVLAFALATWERWWPATPVETVRVTAIGARPGGSDSAAPRPNTAAPTIAFQASGWAEADPYAVRATSLVDGVIESVLVLEGETVERGQPLARLDSADLDLAVDRARTARSEAAAAVETREAALRATEAGLARHAARIRAAQARLEEAADEAQRLEEAGASIGAGLARRAALRRDAVAADLEALRDETAVLDAAVDRARSELALARARVESAEVVLAQAELDRQRATITAPIDGVVQRLFAVPGRKLMLGMDDPYSATVAELYDPQRLQVRVDVPLADAGGLFVGQQARVDSAILPDHEWRAEVTRIEGQADLTRNTLQAKLRILGDPRPLRPEMLCRARFFSAPATTTAAADGDAGGADIIAANGGRLELWLPHAVVGGAREEAEVFVVGADDRLERRRLRLGARRDEMVRVRDGLRPGEHVVIDPAASLEAGDRVAMIEAEDER